MHLSHRDDTSARACGVWVKSINRLERELSRAPVLTLRGNPLYRRRVAKACLPDLLEIRAVLGEAAGSVPPHAMRRLREFLTDGANSPFYDENPESARRGAHELATTFAFYAASAAIEPRSPRHSNVTPVGHAA
jgi:hypothetical protein